MNARPASISCVFSDIPSIPQLVYLQKKDRTFFIVIFDDTKDYYCM